MPNTTSIAQVAIVAAKRTAIGAFGGVFNNTDAPTLGVAAAKAALAQAKFEPDAVGRAIFGEVLTAGLGLNPTRKVALQTGLSKETPAVTVNQACGSGLRSVADGYNAIMLGQADVVLAGGMENMSQSPYLLPDYRWGGRMGNGQIVDSIIHDGLSDSIHQCHMAETAEELAKRYEVSRQEQDRFAAQSQSRCAAAVEQGLFGEEIVAVEVPQRKGESLRIDKDEHPRPQTTQEVLAKLKPAFRADGTVTAGNASGVNDAAAAVILASSNVCHARDLQPLAWLRGHVDVGVEPMVMGIGPAFAIRKLLEQHDLSLDEIDLFEINEAFAGQAVAVCRELQLSEDHVNVNGGAIALGHPIGASGTRILVTLLYEMRRRNALRGVASLCIGGGMGIAVLVELAQ